MAIDNGILISCADLQAVGGIREIFLTNLDNIAGITYDTATGKHDISSLTTTVDWARFEFKHEVAAMTINGTKENGSTAYEVGLNFYLPNITGAKFHELMNLSYDPGACIVACVKLNSGKQFVIGLSERYEALSGGSTQWLRNQTFANLTTIEGGSGSAYADDNGVTVTIMARQFDLPYEYTGTMSIDSTNDFNGETT